MANKCNNCKKHDAYEKSNENLCKKCLSFLPRLNCLYCTSDFHQIAKFKDSKLCKRCVASVPKHGEPSACDICNLPAAFVGGTCHHCKGDTRRYGEPVDCDHCSKSCAFNKPEESKEKVDNKTLCFVCTRKYKLERKQKSNDEISKPVTSSSSSSNSNKLESDKLYNRSDTSNKNRNDPRVSRDNNTSSSSSSRRRRTVSRSRSRDRDRRSSTTTTTAITASRGSNEYHKDNNKRLPNSTNGRSSRWEERKYLERRRVDSYKENRNESSSSRRTSTKVKDDEDMWKRKFEEIELECGQISDTLDEMMTKEIKLNDELEGQKDKSHQYHMELQRIKATVKELENKEKQANRARKSMEGEVLSMRQTHGSNLISLKTKHNNDLVVLKDELQRYKSLNSEKDMIIKIIKKKLKSALSTTPPSSTATKHLHEDNDSIE